MQFNSHTDGAGTSAIEMTASRTFFWVSSGRILKLLAERAVIMYFHCRVLHIFVIDDDTYALRKSTRGNCTEMLRFLSRSLTCCLVICINYPSTGWKLGWWQGRWVGELLSHSVRQRTGEWKSLSKWGKYVYGELSFLLDLEWFFKKRGIESTTPLSQGDLFTYVCIIH